MSQWLYKAMGQIRAIADEKHPKWTNTEHKAHVRRLVKNLFITVV
ncbi:MAG: hypothetical protein OXB88_00305 [Bacteriovoracales bacterium]|nr:hypothetical protein [Bacteriovoracales bacterium]